MGKEFKKELEEKRSEILAQISEWSENGYFEINGRRYEISKLSHQFRLEVVAIYSQIEANLTMGNYGFFMNEDFKKLMRKVDDRILFDGSQISKIPNHFDKYAEDYLDYVSLSLKVISYPFYKNKLNIG